MTAGRAQLLSYSYSGSRLACMTVMTVLAVAGSPAAGRGPFTTSGHTSPVPSTDPSEEDASDHCSSFRSATSSQTRTHHTGFETGGGFVLSLHVLLRDERCGLLCWDLREKTER